MSQILNALQEKASFLNRTVNGILQLPDITAMAVLSATFKSHLEIGISPSNLMGPFDPYILLGVEVCATAIVSNLNYSNWILPPVQNGFFKVDLCLNLTPITFPLSQLTNGFNLTSSISAIGSLDVQFPFVFHFASG